MIGENTGDPRALQDDCGFKTGFLAANVAFGLERPEHAPELKAAIVWAASSNDLR
jgi:UTP-glucose-1-phosphate uridylyltransferase